MAAETSTCIIKFNGLRTLQYSSLSEIIIGQGNILTGLLAITLPAKGTAFFHFWEATLTTWFLSLLWYKMVNSDFIADKQRIKKRICLYIPWPVNWIRTLCKLFSEAGNKTLSCNVCDISRTEILLLSGFVLSQFSDVPRAANHWPLCCPLSLFIPFTQLGFC